jgi:pimeloyl-ACP methyl ester carboxylesterase
MKNDSSFRGGGRGARWWLGRLSLGLGVLAVTLAAGTTLTSAKLKRDLNAQYPPPGQLVDVGGYRLHLYCQGSGGPTVVMDTGTGGNLLAWSSVQPEVAKFTRVCTYDRAGLGWSDPSPRPRTTEVMVDELHTLLERAGVPQPYVLVGHSFGGLNARMFAHTYPGEVAGLVLLDSQHEQGESRFPQEYAKNYQTFGDMAGLLIRTRIASLLGSVNAIRPLMLDQKDVAALAPEQAGAYVALQRLNGIEGSLAEFTGLTASFAQGRAAGIADLGDLPLVVLSHEVCEGCGTTPEMVAQVEQVHQQLQAELAAQSARGRHAVASGSGHHIPRDRPDLVIEAVREVVEVVWNDWAPKRHGTTGINTDPGALRHAG